MFYLFSFIVLYFVIVNFREIIIKLSTETNIVLARKILNFVLVFAKTLKKRENNPPNNSAES